MEAVDSNLISQIIAQTDSVLLLFFALLVMAAGPIGLLLSRHAGKRRDQDITREQNIIQVVTSNTSAMTDLRACIDANNNAIQKVCERIDRQQDLIKGLIKPRRPGVSPA